jgi:hypothetical protein
MTAGVWLALTAAPAMASEPVALPSGLHRGAGGRYFQDVCDHALPVHCLSKRLLPEGFDPFEPGSLAPLFKPRPLFGGQFCAVMQAGQGDSAPPSGAMAPSDVVSAYSLPASSAAHGQIVAVVDMPDSTAFADVNQYRAAFGLPALPQCAGGLPDGKTPCFAQVDANGTPNFTSLDCPGADPETGLDMEMVSAACPDCSILVVQMTNADSGPSYTDFSQAVQTAAKLGAVATSISFGIPEQGGESTGFTTPGHLVLAASGDGGYLNVLVPQIGGQSPSYPASAPDVIGVGGTELMALGGGAYGERVWNDGQGGAGGSGCSIEFPFPAYQSTYLAAHAGGFGACGKRDSVDVSAAAEFAPAGDNETGIAEFDTQDRWGAVVGTSASSPMVAGILTRLGLSVALSNDLGLPYQNEGAFNDVTVGDNLVGNTCPDMNCKAGLGWDGPTGLGSPDGAKLAILASRLGSGSSSGGSSGGAGPDGGTVGQSTAKADCGCEAAGASASTRGLWGLALACTSGVAWLRRRRPDGPTPGRGT